MILPPERQTPAASACLLSCYSYSSAQPHGQLPKQAQCHTRTLKGDLQYDL